MSGGGNWQPIEAYRKVCDKTKAVLLYIPGWGVTLGRPEFTGYSSFIVEGNRVPEQPDTFPDPVKGPKRAPTHWQPLPEPPEAA